MSCLFRLVAKGHPYSRRLRRKPAGQIWAASPKADGWTRSPLTLPGDYGPPVADLDAQGTLHLTSARDGSWFIFYLQLPDMALSVRAPTGSVYFDPLLVPELNPEPGRKVLFLDMLEVGALDGLDESFHPMRKHSANPVLRPGPAGSWDDKRAIAYGEVFHEEGRFRIWYAGIDRQASGYMVG